MKTMNAKKTAIAQAMSKPEGYSLEDDFSPESQDEPQNKKTASRKLSSGEGKKIALNILLFLMHALNKSIRYFPLMLFICAIGILAFVPVNVLFEIKTEWQNSGVLGVDDFSKMIEMTRTVIWYIWLITFMSVVVSDMHYLTLPKHNAAFSKSMRGETK
ncbi:hypothetical protein ACUTFT_22465 [Citrobacter freundii]|uniref:hypothetical protein n=1 Tax=Enterobacteriaceae TaxID=543 RepID=UPI000DEDBAB2|nr:MULTISPECIES: hypothetical protein [Enterobacteriaceae]HBW8875642.1 hypothetical protein [Klebsiella quasipneumoniae subsp. similipneumoniae]HDJ9421627.1 hypothetical protein [Escherichia coli]HDL8516980.1 hypothetical protein [Yersinia enterocolitica]MBM3074093.1 hypothetical protein [Lelliottia sp. RWM.1]MDT7062912.1 hypothetical protein [Citrobacter braakii]